jgi:hypothetical protein
VPVFITVVFSGKKCFLHGTGTGALRLAFVWALVVAGTNDIFYLDAGIVASNFQIYRRVVDTRGAAVEKISVAVIFLVSLETGCQVCLSGGYRRPCLLSSDGGDSTSNAKERHKHGEAVHGKTFNCAREQNYVLGYIHTMDSLIRAGLVPGARAEFTPLGTMGASEITVDYLPQPDEARVNDADSRSQSEE